MHNVRIGLIVSLDYRASLAPHFSSLSFALGPFGRGWSVVLRGEMTGIDDDRALFYVVSLFFFLEKQIEQYAVS